MAAVQPQPPSGKTPSQMQKKEEVLQTSPLAVQVTSEEALLAKIAKETPFKGIPVLGWIGGKFARGSVKKEYIKHLEKLFVDKAMDMGIKEEKAKYFFSIMKPKLLQTHLEDLTHIEKVLASKGGAFCFAMVFNSFKEKSFSDLKNNLRTMIDLLIKASKINPDHTAKMIESFPKVAFMLQDRFTPEQHYEYLKLSLLAVINSQHLQIRGLRKDQIINEIHTFVNLAEKMQNERPQIYYNNPPGPNKKEWQVPEDQQKLNAAYGSIFSLPTEFRFLSESCKEILEMTLLTNEQVIHENIRLNFRDPSFTERTVPTLEKREAAYNFGTSREFHRSVTTFEKPDQKGFFEGSTDIYLTNEKTMETRCVRLKLPFSGEMTQENSEHLLSFLEEVFKHSDAFDQQLEKLSEEEKPFIEKEKVFSWISEVKSQYALALFDLNSTKKRPKMASAREEKATSQAIQNPTNRADGFIAAQQKNIYNVQGRLSLLPEEVAKEQPELAFIRSDELQSAQSQLRSNQSIPIRFSLSDDWEATLSLKYETVVIDGHQLIKLKTTIQALGRSHTRETFYKLQAGEAVQQKIGSIIGSRLFERDLLLAKAESLSAFAVNRESLENLQSDFISIAQAKGYSASDAQFLFETDFLPYLLKMNVEERDLFHSLLKMDEGVNLIFNTLKNADGLQKALSLFPKILFLMNERFSAEDKQAFLKQILLAAAEPRVINLIANFIPAAEALQKERGQKIYTVSDLTNPKFLGFIEIDTAVRNLPNHFLFLKKVMQEVTDMTWLSNSQIIHYSIHTLHDPSTLTGRINPTLTKRSRHSFTTSNEYPPPRLTLYSDSSDEIDFQFYTDLYVTNEKTMETRAVHVKLPFSGKMAQTTARRLLVLLERVTADGTDFFDKHLEASGLSEEDKRRWIDKEAILKWIDNIDEVFAKALFDLNSTPTRPKMSFAKESPQTGAAIESPKDPKKAILAASEKNIYNSEGRLSLLPAEVAKDQPEIAFLGVEFPSLKDRLVQNQSVQTTIALSPEIRDAQLIIVMKPIEIEESPYLEMETIVTSGALSHTRITRYPLNEPLEQKIESLVQSNHLERDLLLAKAEFYEKL